MMTISRHHVIYVPGIGDTKTTFQELAAKTWHLYGVVPHTYAIRWADGEPFAPKFERLLARIDELQQDGQQVSLVGASDGATVVINAFMARPEAVRGIVCISGKINNPHTIGSWYRRHTPGFIDSAEQAGEAISRYDEQLLQRLLSLYGAADPIVPRRDSIVPGATNKTMPSIGHAVSIAFGLLLAPVYWIGFLRRLPRADQN